MSVVAPPQEVTTAKVSASSSTARLFGPPSPSTTTILLRSGVQSMSATCKSTTATSLFSEDHNVDGHSFHASVRERRLSIAVGETVILLHPTSPFSRCFNMDVKGVSVKLTVSPTAKPARIAAQSASATEEAAPVQAVAGV